MLRARRLVLLLLLLGRPASAQTTTGGLEGRIFDPARAVVPNATVHVTDKATGVARSAQTGAQGYFRLEGLPPSAYHVEISAARFQTASLDLTIRVGETARLDWTLTIHGDVVSVDVEGGLPNASSNVLGSPVSDHEIQTTPLAQRSFANIAYIAPMTAPVEPSDPTKARITAVSFAGSSGLNVDLSVDGGDNNDDWIGGFLQNYSPEAIREFNVRTAQFDPDTSRTNGGSVVISTQSGTNAWHGSLAGYFRATPLNARNVLDNPEPDPKQPYDRQDYVATLGGPIIKDKLWLFSSYEYNHEDASIAYSALSQTQFHALAQLAQDDLIPGVSSIDVPSSTPVPFRDSLFNIRTDWQQSAASRWFFRFSLDSNKTENDLVQQGTLPNTGFTTHSNYYDYLISNQYSFGSHWLGSLVLSASLFSHDKVRNSDLGFALAFPFSTTAITTSGFETYGDNQFVTTLTAFPIQRNQQKYQFRYDLSRSGSKHNLNFGVNFIHEPVLSGAFAGTAETLVAFPHDPAFYLADPAQFTADYNANAEFTPARDGRFSQNIQRLGFYAQDSWRLTPSLVFNYGLRYDTTFGLFLASGRDQDSNPALLALRAAGVPFAGGIPHDYRGAVAPRIGLAYSPGSGDWVLRSGFGLYYNDLAQNGWAEAFQAVNGGANPPSSMIDPDYHTPYSLQASAAVERRLARDWTLSAQYELQTGMHQYRRYDYISGISLPASVPDTSVFRSDNRSSYNGVSLIAQHHGGHYDLTAHYTFAHAITWGNTVGELFDYVNGVSNVLDPFGPGDKGPSGEDIRHRFVLNGIFRLPAQFQVSTLMQFESARPYTMSTPLDVNGDGNVNDRAVVNGVQTSLDEFRGRPFAQVDMRVARPFHIGERVSVMPFVEFFNLLNRTNPGNNYIPDISALPIPVNDLANATAFCLNAACTVTQPIRSINDLRQPAGALGDFFGPGTTVGIPFAAQFGFKLNF